MKKLLGIVAIAIMFVACGDDSPEDVQETKNINTKEKTTNARHNIIASCSIKYKDILPNKDIEDVKYTSIKDANKLKEIVINLRKQFERHEGNYLSSIMLGQSESTQKTLYKKLYNEYVPYKTELLKIHTLAKKRLEISVEQLKNAFNDLKTSDEELDDAFRAEEMYTDLVNTTKRYIEIVECSE